MKSLYISYDGVTDPLGNSQILPYIEGLAASGHKFTLLSCEKPQRFAQRASVFQERMKAAGIRWEPLKYHKSPPVLSTLYDLHSLKKRAFELHRQEKFDVVHCRSYISSLVGLEMKKRFKTKFIFDMRGFWADERVDGGLWPQSNPLYKTIYTYFKNKEREFLENADSIVSLTHAAKKEMKTWPAKMDASKVAVIPCCTDLNLFSREKADHSKVEKLRNEFGRDRLVLTYVGSLGTWYLLNEMLEFFKEVLASEPNALFLFVTPEPASMVFDRARDLNIPEQNLKVVSSAPEDVRNYLAASDIGVYFIKPSYSKMSSSPIKLGEMLAMGLPVIANGGVGDTDLLFEQDGIGHTVKAFSQAEYARAAARISELLKLKSENLRKFAEKHFSLAEGVALYNQVYNRL